MESVDYEFLGAEERAGSFVEPHGCLRTAQSTSLKFVPTPCPYLLIQSKEIPSAMQKSPSPYSSARLRKSHIAMNEHLRTATVESLELVEEPKYHHTQCIQHKPSRSRFMPESYSLNVAPGSMKIGVDLF